MITITEKPIRSCLRLGGIAPGEWFKFQGASDQLFRKTTKGVLVFNTKHDNFYEVSYETFEQAHSDMGLDLVDVTMNLTWTLA
jgi:hypothetical protein